MTKLKLKINTNFPGRNLKAGDQIEVEVDGNNTPLDLYWRRRVKDSHLDNCVELIINNSKKSKK